MKKVLLLLCITLLLTGCRGVLENDVEYDKLVRSLKTPEIICQHMKDNFTLEAHLQHDLTPYELYQETKGDCWDFVAFGMFVAHFHRYKVYWIYMVLDETVHGEVAGHAIAIYKVGRCYHYSEWGDYYITNYKEFIDIINEFDGWIIYKVYDYNMKLIEKGKR